MEKIKLRSLFKELEVLHIAVHLFIDKAQKIYGEEIYNTGQSLQPMILDNYKCCFERLNYKDRDIYKDPNIGQGYDVFLRCWSDYWLLLMDEVEDCLCVNERQAKAYIFGVIEHCAQINPLTVSKNPFIDVVGIGEIEDYDNFMTHTLEELLIIYELDTNHMEYQYLLDARSAYCSFIELFTKKCKDCGFNFKTLQREYYNVRNKDRGITPSIPKELLNDVATKIFKKAIKGGFLNEDYTKTDSCTTYQLAYFAELMSEKLSLRHKWKPFISLWGNLNFSQTRRESKERFGQVPRAKEIESYFE